MIRPCVSVVTPAYDAQAVLERAVGSVLSQGAVVLEHIVIDDGSGDSTARLLQGLAADHSRLVVVSQPRRGAAAARNRGIELARGRYIAFLDSDDEWTPDKLPAQIGFMERTGTLFSYGDYLHCPNERREAARKVPAPDKLSYADFLRGCPIGCLTAAFNQEVLGKRFMPEVGRGQDWGLWLNLTRAGTVARRYPGLEAIYHRRDGSLSGKKLRKARDIYRIYRDQEGLGPLRSGLYLAEHSMRSFIK